MLTRQQAYDRCANVGALYDFLTGTDGLKIFDVSAYGVPYLDDSARLEAAFQAANSNGGVVRVSEDLTLTRVVTVNQSPSKIIHFEQRGGMITVLNKSGGVDVITTPFPGLDRKKSSFSADGINMQAGIGMGAVPFLFRVRSAGVAYISPQVRISNVIMSAGTFQDYAREGLVLENISFFTVTNVTFQGGSRNGVLNRMQDGTGIVLRHSGFQVPGASPVDCIVLNVFAIDCLRPWLVEGLEGVTLQGGRAVNTVVTGRAKAFAATTGVVAADTTNNTTTFTTVTPDWLKITITEGANSHEATVTAMTGTSFDFTPPSPVAFTTAAKVRLGRTENVNAVTASVSAGGTSISVDNSQVVAIALDRADGMRHVTHLLGLSAGVYTMQDNCTGVILAGTVVEMGGKEPLLAVYDWHGNNQQAFLQIENYTQVKVRGCWPYKNQTLIALDTVLTATAAASSGASTLTVSDARYCTAGNRLRIALNSGGTQILKIASVDYGTKVVTFLGGTLSGDVASGNVVELLVEYRGIHKQCSFSPGGPARDKDTYDDLFFENLSTDDQGHFIFIEKDSGWAEIGTVRTSGTALLQPYFFGTRSENITLKRRVDGNPPAGTGSWQELDVQIPAVVVGAGATTDFVLTTIADGQYGTLSGHYLIYSGQADNVQHGGRTFNAAYKDSDSSGGTTAQLTSYSVNNSSSSAFAASNVSVSVTTSGNKVQLTVANTNTFAVRLEGVYSYINRKA